MAREINLDGSEITIIKALGLGGAEMSGEDLMKKIPNLSAAELSEVLRGLIGQGYADSDLSSFYSDDDFKKANFQVNPGYSRDLREAMDPDTHRPKSRRVRRE